jgi:PAS domain S-box-containing protein
MSNRWAATFLFLCLGAGGAQAAEERLRFGHLTIQDGLSHNWVLSILKDSRGFLWFGTQDGLNRYDGAGIKVYRNDPNDPGSLPSSVAGVLYEDRQDRLWVGSFWGARGVALYDRAQDRFKGFLPNPDRPLGNHVRAILEDRDGRIWLGTDDGIAQLDPDTGEVKRYPLLPEGQLGSPASLVVSLFEDSRGRFWVGTSAGLLRFDRKSGAYTRWPGDAADRYGLHQADVWAFHEADNGQLWIATLGAGLHRLDPETGKDTRYLPDPRNPSSISHLRVTRLVPDGKGLLYVGTENGGLNIFDTRRETFQRFLPDIDDETSLNSKSIWSLCLDDQGTLWMGTFNGGVNSLSAYLQRFQHLRAGRGYLNDPHVSSVLEDRRGTLWVGTDGGGLNRLDSETGAFTYYRTDPDDPTTIGSDAVWALHEDSRGSLWLGGWDGGLGRLDQRSGRVTRFRNDPDDPRSIVSNHVWRILELRTGEMLVVTQAGADLFDRDTGTFTRLTALYPGAGEDVLYAGAEDAQGNLWLVGNVFVGRIDRRSRQVTRYRHDPADPESLGRGWAQAVFVDSRGNVWVGTEGGLSGLAAGSDRWTRYTTDDGLSHNAVVGIAEDASGSLWVATSRGLDKVVDAIHLPGSPVVLNFDSHDGVQGLEFARGAAFRSLKGRLYFGGAQGLTSFVPEQVRSNPQKPPVVITDLKVLNSSVRPGAPGSPLSSAITEVTELTLSHRHSIVTFEFAALNYVLPEKNQYAYMLEGFDPGWSQPGARPSATYTNLPRNTPFTFRVKASNNDGVWNDEGVALKVFVTPRWFERWTVRGLGLLLLVLAAGAGYRLRVRTLKERERELARRVEEQTADLHREITEHKRTEEKLAVSLGSLETENQERRRAEEAAGRERDLLHALMDNIPDHIYFKDSSSRFTRINRAHAESLGLSAAEEAVGKTDADFFADEFARAAREDERALMESGQPLLGKVEQDPRSQRWYLATKVPIRSAAGEVAGLVGISKDITERRQAEERLRQDLEAFQGVARRVTEGDLTLRAQESEETLGRIAGSVNVMLESFCQILRDVRDAAFSVSTASSEILAASTQIAKAGRHGRDEMHATSTAMEQMATSMSQVAQSAEQSAMAARQVLEHLQGSDQAVDATAQGMARIDGAVSATAEKMRLLGERSGEIFEIIDMIEEIASRSELLSMNAAIEAAHAGDLGRGFGVVAEEIRLLAERSNDATRNVTAIVKGMAGEIRAALEAMENSTREVKQGLALSQKARSGLEEISNLVQRATDLAGQISAATGEQTSAAKTVAQAMQAIASITEESTAGSNETTRAVQDLVSLSEQLNGAISRFRIDRPTPAHVVGSVEMPAHAVDQIASVCERLDQAIRRLSGDAANPAQAPSGERGRLMRELREVGSLSSDLGRVISRLKGGAGQSR